MRIEIDTGSPGLVLRELVPEDSRLLYELIERNREHLSQYLDVTSQKYPDYDSVVASFINPNNLKRLRFGIWDDGELVGSISLSPLSKLAELGYWVSADRTRRGYASSASTALCRYAYETLGITRIIAFVHKDNAASQGVLTQCGFACYGMALKSKTALTYRKDA